MEAEWYDKIYAWKDYATESAEVARLLQAYGVATGSRLLDVGCGTGRHLAHLGSNFRAEGLDGSREMLDMASRRAPEASLHLADLAGPLPFLTASFDAVISLFGVIGYIGPAARMRRAVHELARVLRPGGVLLIEPWLTPNRVVPGRVMCQTYDGQTLKLARMSRLEQKGSRSILHFHWMVGREGEPVRYVRQRHCLHLYSEEQMREALVAAGLRPTHLAEGLMADRGLWLGVREAQCRTPT